VDLLSKRELNNGFGESLSRAFELVLTPGIFGFFGFLLDRWAGTAPLFMLVFALGVFGYLCWKFWGDYERRMQVHEQRLGVGPRVVQPSGASRRNDSASGNG
jgi:Flp pilus assembly protein TadB